LVTSSAVVLLVKVIPLLQFGHWVRVSDIMTGVDRSVGRGVGRNLMCQVVDGYWVVLALSKEVVLGVDFAW
jgi:hypothetical protein